MKTQRFAFLALLFTGSAVIAGCSMDTADEGASEDVGAAEQALTSPVLRYGRKDGKR